jgi:hypothetical protein
VFAASATSIVFLCPLFWSGLSVGGNSAASAKNFDLVVVGGTPGGVACAVRAAREGLHVLLVNHHAHLGGMLASGLGVWDTLHEGRRSPIYDELRQAIFDYYRDTYGKNSPQYRAALPGASGHTNGRFEAKVAEKLITAMVEREASITVLKGFYPQAVERDGSLLRSVTFHAMNVEKTVRVAGAMFADCTYEGDLLAIAKVPYRVGREARAEFKEPHAGRLFLRPVSRPTDPALARLAVEHDRLKLRKFTGWQESLAESTGESDRAVQAFNFRTVLSSDPENRILPRKPKDYDPERLRDLEYGSIVGPLPNNKIGWNRPQLVGVQHDYPQGDWNKRR